MLKKRSLFYLVSLLMVLSLAIVAGCGTDNAANQDNKPAVDEPAQSNEPAQIDQASEIIKATADFMNSGKGFTISPEDVKKIVDEKDDSYQILSVRSAEDYAKGHVPGSINIPFKEIAKKENLEKLDPNKTIIVVCYTGHTASQTAMFLNQLGYTAMSMKYGISGWTTEPEVYALNDGKVWSGDAPDYEVEAGINEAEAKYDIPVVDNGAADAEEAIINAANAYLTGDKGGNIGAKDVKEKVLGSDEYQIVSVRNPVDYERGHIPGAINIPFKDIAKEENLKKLDPNKKIVVYCYTGHTASYTTMFFNQLGYETYNLKFGMTGWTDDESTLTFTAGDGTEKVLAGYNGEAPNWATEAAE